ncbi:hypothetical protein [Leptolyngbya sp. FACHB-711]|uniref:hypothetical protein n=1 Tax=unclassified Leptolyngbya TaxID=2650499 RepID=UPI00168849E0|nr:hypothetical protein [Leptolyngbya sp. FACHB-711]MBD1849509.1 hypothetical protein [Cyanobacteria bacterium FACHB-502]MBD2023976.1 hypothetical protein [Leptolyngbya sp. FACHB-711]
MKRFLLPVFLPFLLSQSIATAQTAPQAPAPPDVPSVPQGQPVIGNQPPVIPLQGTDQIQLRLVNCRAINCLLSRLFLPASSRLNQLSLELDNPSATPVQILSSAVSVRGEFNLYPLTSNALSLPQEPITLPAQQITTIPLTINRSVIPPDRYIGKIYLVQANQSNRLVLPVNMSVRSSPLMPLLVLLLGIVLGQLFKYMQEQGGPQSKARKKVYQLEEDIRDAHPGDRKILLPMIRDVRKRVYRQQLEVVDTQITLIQSRLAVLNQLRSIENGLYEKQKQNDLIDEETFGQIQTARDLIARGQDDAATTAVSEILQSISATRRGGAADDSDSTAAALHNVAVNLDKSARNAIVEAEKIEPPTRSEQLQQFLVSLSGFSDQARAEATFWFVRPLLYLVLLTGLTLTGLNTLYIEKGDAFGARPMSDYLALLLWGLSADVASRSLSNLQGQRQ